MGEEFRITIVAGARPNFMKLAPIVHAFSRSKNLNRAGEFIISIVHTGQHYDLNMSDIFFQDLGIPMPDCCLEVGSGTHAQQTANIMIAFEEYLLKNTTNLVIVVGDVNSTLACALTAKKLGIRVAHVEAGLRSFDMEMPEEINRKLTDAISDLLFVTEDSGVRNLISEGVSEKKIFLVGNVMIDTLVSSLAKIDQGDFRPSAPIQDFCNGSKRYAVLTLHRPTNVDSRETLEPLWGAILEVAQQIPILFPVHPRTRAKIATFGLDIAQVSMIEPIGHLDMLFAVKGATMVLTDSGGLQEETTALRIPCVTLRNNTERPVTVDIGTNYLAGTNPKVIIASANEILKGTAKRGTIPQLWDGNAAKRIVEIILREIQ